MIRYTQIALLTGLLTFQLSSAQDETNKPMVQTIAQDRQERIEFLNPEYLLFAPQGQANEKAPLLIYLHGAGGRGNNINKIQGQAGALSRGMQQFNKAPCFIVAPQCLKSMSEERKSTWTANDLNQLLKHLRATLEFDEDRVYLTGNSMGGYGTWAWAAQNPEHFAAIAPISGGIGRGGPKDITPDLDQWAQALVDLPVYAFVGAKDKVVPPDRSQRVVEAIQQAGGSQAQLKVYPDQGHGANKAAYSSPEFYEWLFSKRRK
jgi:predicted peptidase